MLTIFTLISFIIDLILSTYFPVDFSAMRLNYIPAATLLFLVFSSPKRPLKNSLTLGFAFGLLWDLMQYQNLFTYALIYPFTIFIISVWLNNLSDSVLEKVMIGCLAVFVKETGVYLLFVFNGFTNMAIAQWFANRVFFSIFGNIPVIFLVLYILKIFERVSFQLQKSTRQKERLKWYRLGQDQNPNKL